MPPGETPTSFFLTAASETLQSKHQDLRAGVDQTRYKKLVDLGPVPLPMVI